MNSNLMTATFISNVLEEEGIVEIVKVENFDTRRMVKGTRLKTEWTW